MLGLDAKTDMFVKAANVRRRGILQTKLFGAIIQRSRCLAGGGWAIVRDSLSAAL